MRRHTLILFLLLAFCQKTVAQDILPEPIYTTDTISLGDLNRDKIIDYAYLTHPKWVNSDEYFTDFNDDGGSITVVFSFEAPSIHHEKSVDALIQSIGDIDEDGIDEIIVAQGWWIGCRGMRYFYTLKKGKWVLIGETYHFNCLSDEDPFDPEVKKTKRGTFETPHLEFSEEEGDEVTVMKTFTIDA